ncbi:MAG: DMT family transporter [Rhizobiaceae bacterium]|nr:DMT family transporter [Rhizobiaceae bacterium]
MKTSHTTGVILVCISALVFSTAGIFTKGVDTNAWGVIFWRGISAALFTVFYTVYRGTFGDELRRFGMPAILATVFMAAGTAAFIPAFKLTSIANVALIWASAPFITAIIAWIVLREQPSSRVLMAAVAAIVGVGIVVGGSLGGAGFDGDLLALIMTLMMAGVMVVYRKWPDTPAALPAALSSVILLPVALVAGDPLQSPPGEIPVLIIFGLVFAIASVTLLEGVRRVPAAEAALLGAIETPLAPIWAFFLFSQIPSNATFAGGAIILAAIVWSQMPRIGRR